MTAGERTKVGNLSWTNTGDETTATIKTKLGTASASADWYLTKEDFATFNGKQNALTTQTAYTTKGTATKVPTITTNSLWQVTGITETSIAFPVTSVNGSTWSVTVSEFTPSWTATTGYVVTKTAWGYEWAAPSGWDVMVSTQTWNVLQSWMKIWAGTESNYSNLGTYDDQTVYLTF
jgi:hypothetical protein